MLGIYFPGFRFFESEEMDVAAGVPGNASISDECTTISCAIARKCGSQLADGGRSVAAPCANVALDAAAAVADRGLVRDHHRRYDWAGGLLVVGHRVVQGWRLCRRGIAMWVFALFYGTWFLWAIAAFTATRSNQVRSAAL